MSMGLGLVLLLVTNSYTFKGVFLFYLVASKLDLTVVDLD